MAGQLARTASTAAARYQPQADVPADVQQWQMIQEQATFLSNAGDLVPKAYRDNPGAIMAAGLAGQPFGWNVITSMRMGHVINGGWQLNAESQAALIRQAGHRLEITRSTDKAVVTGTRRDDGTSYTATWDQARAEGVPSVEWEGQQGNRRKVETNLWEKWKKGGTTEYMLAWRAISEVARFLFAELMYGMAYAEGERSEVEDLEPPAPAEIVTAELVDGRVQTITLQAIDIATGEVLAGDEPEPQVNLFGEPAEPPAGDDYLSWETADWARACADKLSLPDIGRRWKGDGVRGYRDIPLAAPEIRTAIYQAIVEAGA